MELKRITEWKSNLGEARELDNDYTFDNLQDYRNAEASLIDGGFYRAGDGNPPTRKDPNSYAADERWLNLRIIRGEKEAAELIKKTKTKYKSKYATPKGYIVHNQGGYLD